MTPARQRNVLATSPVTRDRLAQPDELIIVAEGVTRVDALAAHDIPAVGILGINNWRTGRPPTAIGDFEALGIKGNRFVIAPDGDVRVNKNVNAAVKRLRTLLLGKGADKVFVMALPGTQGLDDWLAASQFKDRDAVGHAMLELCTDSVEDPARRLYGMVGERGGGKSTLPAGRPDCRHRGTSRTWRNRRCVAQGHYRRSASAIPRRGREGRPTSSSEGDSHIRFEYGTRGRS